MPFCDLCTRLPADRLDESAAMAKRLGWHSLGVLSGERDVPLPAGEGSVFHVTEITPRKVSDVANACKRLRRSHLILAVATRDLECARAALETPEADVLLYEGPLNHVMAKLGRENSVAVAFDFSRVLSASDRSRTLALAEMTENARLVRKFRTPFILTSGAREPWSLRAPRDLAAWGRTLGLEEKQSMSAVSDAIVRENEKRLSGKWISPGVEMV